MASPTNLPGIFDIRQDGDLSITAINDDPIICVIGTATQGASETLTVVNKVTDSAVAFGRQGTLVRGLYEVAAAGGRQIRLFRIGASPAILANVGSDGAGDGIDITTIAADDTAGTQYTIFWDASEHRLRIWRASDSELVYDNNPTYPSLVTDLGEVEVSGTFPLDGVADIGSLATPVTLAAGDGIAGATYTAGTDGVTLNGVSDGLSRMEMFEHLYNAYELLENADLDVIVPMDVYQDDLNVMDLTQAQIATAGLTALSAYPLAGATTDYLGLVYVQEYLGTNYFWWWFPTNTLGVRDTQFTNDGGANIFPTAGSASATTDCNGNTITGSDFHEANFAYQLANFCHVQSRDEVELQGYIGTRPPASFSAADVSNWIGTLPTHAVDTDGNDTITANGTGLLGNKWHAGRLSNGGTGLPGHTVDAIDGLWTGGYIATDTGWPDGTQEEDRNGRLVDIGKFISVVPALVTLSNPFQTRQYITSFAATYAGLDSVLDPKSAATNKQVAGVRLPYDIKTSKLDALAGRGYIMIRRKLGTVRVADAPTAAREGSDWRRQTTMKIVKLVVDGIRSTADPFLGESLLGVEQAALETALERQLMKYQKDKYIRRFELNLTSTASERVLGQATVELKLVPAFELRQLTVNIALAAS